MNRKQLERLKHADAVIRQTAEEMGLELLPQEFDVVPARKMLEIMAYHLPVNFSHWSFGRDYEIERTRYEHGFGVPYEVVFNSNPVRAYLMESNPYPIQVLVMAHVYGHNDFMNVNRHFRGNRLDMTGYASEAAGRFREYEEAYGREAVERLIDAGLAIQWNIDPEEAVHGESEEQARERLYGWAKEPPPETTYDDLLPRRRPKVSTEHKRELRLKTPPEPTVDLLGYLIDHSPRPLSDWEQDVLRVIKAQARYFLPYRRTKIMNEGWATFWHERIMQRLFTEGVLNAEEHGFYNLYNARVKAHNPREINPYLLGDALFRSIERRWNTGRFGREYEELRDASRRENWDTGLGRGKSKIFEVRRTYVDWFFLSEFLDREVIEELGLYVYVEKELETHYESQVEETDWRKVKEILIRSMMNSAVPRILVTDGNYRGALQLHLEHVYEGLPLNEEYCRRTLEHLFYLWKRPVHLATAEPRKDGLRHKMYRCDEEGVHVSYED
jgi:stage V sporulation protein R